MSVYQMSIPSANSPKLKKTNQPNKKKTPTQSLLIKKLKVTKNGNTSLAISCLQK